MFPPEQTIVRRKWLNDNIDKTIIFNKSVNENMKEYTGMLFYRGHIVSLAYKKYISWMNSILSFLFKIWNNHRNRSTNCSHNVFKNDVPHCLIEGSIKWIKMFKLCRTYKSRGTIIDLKHRSPHFRLYPLQIH